MVLSFEQLALMMGVPTALTGLFFWLIQRKIEQRDKQQEEQEAQRERLQYLNIQATMAALSLAEATAEALERTPEIKCNGEMKTAKESAHEVKRDVRQFMEETAVKAVIK